MSLRIVMMATGTFALPTLKQLIESTHHVQMLVTQPDRTGRGHHQHVNPLKELACEHGIPVFQPERASRPEALDQLRQTQADLFLVAAYGQILSAELLSIPRLGAINLHGSLLPKYRGAAPIQYAIWNGELETGVAIFRIQPELDSGPLLGTARTSIGPRETSGQLHDRLAEIAVPITVEVLESLDSGTAVETPQDSSQATFAPKIAKSQGAIDWSRPAQSVCFQVRAMQPWPMPYTFLHQPGKSPQRVLILDADPQASPGGDVGEPGDIVAATSSSVLVQTGEGVVQINTVQPAGKRAMSAADFARGTSLEGCRFADQ